MVTTTVISIFAVITIFFILVASQPSERDINLSDYEARFLTCNFPIVVSASMNPKPYKPEEPKLANTSETQEPRLLEIARASRGYLIKGSFLRIL